MAKITINGKEYDTEELPKEAVDFANSIAFVDSEIIRLENQIKINKAARRMYSAELSKLVEKDN